MLTPRDTPEAKLKCAKDKCRAVFPNPNSDTVFESWEHRELERSAEVLGWRYGRTPEVPVYAWRCKKDARELSTIARAVERR
jgi:hypothetical protein